VLRAGVHGAGDARGALVTRLTRAAASGRIGAVKVFDSDWGGPPFGLFGASHWAALGAVACGAVGLRVLRAASPKAKRRVARWIVGALWTQEITHHAWHLSQGTWDRREHLPLHACAAMLWLGGASLLSERRPLTEVAYFLGTAGAGMALLTPDIPRYGFPHYRYFQFFTSHGLIVLVGLYPVLAEEFRPTWWSLVRAYGLTAALAALVFAANGALGSNYMFLNRKPVTTSVLDPLPQWPGYLPHMAGLALGAYVLLELPFARGRRRDGVR